MPDAVVGALTAAFATVSPSPFHPDFRQAILQHQLERQRMQPRGRKMRVAGTDPARARTVRPHDDPRLDRPVSSEFGPDDDGAVVAHAHAGDSAAERRSDELHQGHQALGVPRRGDGLPASSVRPVDRFCPSSGRATDACRSLYWRSSAHTSHGAFIDGRLPGHRSEERCSKSTS